MFRAIAPTDQNADNLHKVFASQSGCCPEADFTECKYSITLPNASTVTGLTLVGADGASVAKVLATNVGVTADGAHTVVAALMGLINDAGYEHDHGEVPAYRIIASGSNTIIEFFGEAVITSLQRTSGGDIAATATCTRTGICTFFYAWPGSATTSTVTINGVDATLASFTLAGNTAAEVLAALEALANWPTTATTTVVETATAFEITITDIATQTFSLAGADFERSDCKVDYI